MSKRRRVRMRSSAGIGLPTGSPGLVSGQKIQPASPLAKLFARPRDFCQPWLGGRAADRPTGGWEVDRAFGGLLPCKTLVWSCCCLLRSLCCRKVPARLFANHRSESRPESRLSAVSMQLLIMMMMMMKIMKMNKMKKMMKMTKMKLLQQ